LIEFIAFTAGLSQTIHWGKSGNGYVIFLGVHSEAPASWRVGMKFTTSVVVDNAYAGTLVIAALNGAPFPHY
jgi:hypothetical protein